MFDTNLALTVEQSGLKIAVPLVRFKIMNLDQLTAGLDKTFFNENHRIVFWYDPESDFSDDLSSLSLDGVQVVNMEQRKWPCPWVALPIFLRWYLLMSDLSFTDLHDDVGTVIAGDYKNKTPEELTPSG